MGANTKIEWCSYVNAAGVLVPGYTFNPWIGCAHAPLDDEKGMPKEDPACANCYAEVGTMARVHRHRGLPIWGQDAARHRTAADYWRNPLRWNEAARKAGVRPRVFCASLADIFEGRRGLDPWRHDLFRLIETCDALDWLLLTKRPHLAAELAPAAWGGGWPDHVWFGFSAGTQRALERRAPQALRVPARTRFVSLEPLLERVDLTHLDVDGAGDRDWCQIDALTGRHTDMGRPCRDVPHLDWVIVGGESGKAARPFDVAWARSIVKQCRTAGTPVFVKQLGAAPMSSTISNAAFGLRDAPHGIRHDSRVTTGGGHLMLPLIRLRDPKGGDMSEWPADLRVREWPEVRRG